MKNIFIITISLLSIIFVYNNIYAQPYYYFHFDDPSSHDTTILKAMSYNFINKKIIILPISNDIKSMGYNWGFDLMWDKSQNWLVSTITDELFDLQNNLKVMNIPTGFDSKDISDMIYCPQYNKLYINYDLWEPWGDLKNYNYLFIIDPVQKNIINKIQKVYSGVYHSNEPMFLSKDNKILYYYLEDTTAYNQKRYDLDSLCYFSTITNTVINKIPISQFGYPNASYNRIKNGSNGKGVIVSTIANIQTGRNNVFFRIFDFDNNVGSNFINVNENAIPYFTQDGKYLILSIQQLYGNVSAATGTFNLYEISSGNLLQSLNLSPKGDIYTFEQYPNKLYYLLKGKTTFSSFVIDVDSIVNSLQVSSYLNVKLVNSTGSIIPGGSLQYYDGSWKDAINNNNGTFSINTKLKTVSLRMTYAYGSQTLSNVTVGKDTVKFQTVNSQIKLQNSIGQPIDQGTVQYYAGSWRDFGSTVNGTATFELLPGNYSFRMTYAYASNDKAQDIGVNQIVVFQTVNAIVQLKNSSGNPIDQGTVQYYSGAWRTLGTTTNGIASMELLPNNYSFRMTYAFASNDKQQDIGANSTVVFQTTNAQVQLKNSLGNLIDQGTVQYYSGAWRSLGNTTNGIASMELLPNSYSFRMTYAFASNDKQQDIGANSNVIFQTVNAQVQLKNSLSNLIDQGTVQYYSGAWRNLGTTTNGIASIELLSNTYSFRMTYGFISKDISQNIALNNVITYSTVLCTVKVNDSQNQPVNNADIKYYSGAWREIGLTTNGVITKELLPANLSFRVNYNTLQKDLTQDISLNNIVVFGL
jgi:uncharacterized membrane protein YjjB (DUF3815 family)